LENLKRMEDAGAAAIVMQSLFEEQITLESLALEQNLAVGEESQSEAASYFPELPDYGIGPDGYLEHIRSAKASLAIPVIGSLNGVSPGGWTRYAKLIEEAGADALELNVYYISTDADREGVYVEHMYTDLVREVKSSVSIPVAVKIGPYFSSMANMARRLEEAGADALVLFNRFYQPDLDIENLEVTPNIVLSNPGRLRLRLRWLAILHGRVNLDLALTGGVHEGTDVIKAVMAGAKVAMTTSALLKFGIGHLETLRRQLVEWMDEHEYESIEQMYGSMSQKSVPDPAAFERANYMQVIKSYTPVV
jgi:dihydroorotate dehydrogenase (fumarate)